MNLKSSEDSIKKSNELSIAELNHGLSLNQMQLLAYAIYSTQKNGKTEFKKHEFQEKFGIEQYNTEYAYTDSKKITTLQASIKDMGKNYFKLTNVFLEMEYDVGQFTFEWNSKILPHILELKQKYVVTDLKIASKFKSSYSWRLYEYLKGHYGYFSLKYTKQEIFKLFNVEHIKTYQSKITDFKRGVLNVAIKEINKLTELQVRYKEHKKGRFITHFELFWNIGQTVERASNKQLGHISSMLDKIEANTLTYIDLNNEEYREYAINLVKHSKEYESLLNPNTEITVEKADEVIKTLQFNLSMLESMPEKDANKSDKKEPFPDYNWLEDD